MIMPLYISLMEWAASLFVDFPNEDIPQLSDEEKWKEWGNQLIQTGKFADENAPSPENYDSWEKWAIDLYFVMQDNQ